MIKKIEIVYFLLSLFIILGSYYFVSGYNKETMRIILSK